MHDIAEFLGGHDPFRGLDEDTLERLADHAEVEFFPAGRTILPQRVRPQGRIRVIRRGSVELADEGDSIDLLGEGEMFGHPSVLSGLPTRFEARAKEDTLCYSLAADDVVPLLGRPSSIRYLARTLLARAGKREDGLEEPSAEAVRQPAGALVRREAVICKPETTLREAARLMDEHDVSSVLVDLGDEGLGIVTDRDLRSKVVGDVLSADDPLSEAINSPVVSVSAESTGADVMLAMLEHDIRHVPVVSRDSEVLGVIVPIDLVAAETRSLFVLRRAIANARKASELQEAAGRLRSTVVALQRARFGPTQITEVISTVADALIRRMIELAVESEGPPPADFCWMSLGSHGRHEPAPSSDVDSGMAWRDAPESDPLRSASQRLLASSRTTEYMRAIAQQVADTIRVIGWRLDPHGVNAASAFSASSIEEWRSSIESWLARPSDERVLIATSILLDGRIIYGPEESLDVRELLFETGDRETLLSWMLRLALAAKPPTGFLRNIVVEGSGEHAGTLDIKHGGLLPVVDLARYAALKGEIRLTGTVPRLRAASDRGVIKSTEARILEEAFELFSGLRLEHQIGQLDRGEEPDDHLDPRQLDPLTRRYLRDAFREVSAVQRSLTGGLAAP